VLRDSSGRLIAPPPGFDHFRATGR
jgi:hypothetical protein